jgi:hypothetical protein
MRGRTTVVCTARERTVVGRMATAGATRAGMVVAGMARVRSARVGMAAARSSTAGMVRGRIRECQEMLSSHLRLSELALGIWLYCKYRNVTFVTR